MSMGLPIASKDLYQAYVPTVLRDIAYGIIRQKVSLAMPRAWVVHSL